MDSRTARIVAEVVDQIAVQTRNLDGCSATYDVLLKLQQVAEGVLYRLEREEEKAPNAWAVYGSELVGVFLDKGEAEEKRERLAAEYAFRALRPSPFRVVPVLVTPVKEEK